MDCKNLELFAVGNCLMVVAAAVEEEEEELYEIPLGVPVDDHLFHFDGTMVGCLTFVVAVFVAAFQSYVDSLPDVPFRRHYNIYHHHS